MNAVFDGETYELGAAAKSQFFEQDGAIFVHRLAADVEGSGNLLVGHAGANQSRHFMFARGKGGDRVEPMFFFAQGMLEHRLSNGGVQIGFSTRRRANGVDNLVPA